MLNAFIHLRLHTVHTCLVTLWSLYMISVLYSSFDGPKNDKLYKKIKYACMCIYTYTHQVKYVYRALYICIYVCAYIVNNIA